MGRTLARQPDIKSAILLSRAVPIIIEVNVTHLPSGAEDYSGPQN